MRAECEGCGEERSLNLYGICQPCYDARVRYAREGYC